MLISAIVAVALGVAPVNSSSRQIVSVDEAKVAKQIGRYTQSKGKDGKTYIRGFDRRGRAYNLAIDAKGHVQGQVGNYDIAFDVQDPS